MKKKILYYVRLLWYVTTYVYLNILIDTRILFSIFPLIRDRSKYENKTTAVISKWYFYKLRIKTLRLYPDYKLTIDEESTFLEQDEGWQIRVMKKIKEFLISMGLVTAAVVVLYIALLFMFRSWGM